MSENTDTIAAIATASGKGAIGIVKISGARAADIASIITKHLPAPRKARYTPFYSADDVIIDQGVAIYFKGPDSYTGEDVLELQSHGNHLLLDQLLSVAIKAGARIARPGEFTERAFLNDKMDLAQAEAVSDVIQASTTEAASAAVRSLQGEFSDLIAEILEQLINCRVYIESALDFAEEEIDFLKDTELTDRFASVDKLVANLLLRSNEGALLRDGITIVIAGLPNVGKSSLLNRLTGQDTAIVTNIAGTTRDVLKEKINIDGMPIHIIDTAGLRHSDDPIEQEGVKRARDQIRQSDRILLVVEAGTEPDQSLLDELPDNIPVSVVFNKADLHSGVVAEENCILLSAKTGEGFEQLREHLKQCAGFEKTPEGALMARSRHIQALVAAQQHIKTAHKHLLTDSAGELSAEELRLAQDQLSLITGEFSSDDLLGEIFSRFCIGK